MIRVSGVILPAKKHLVIAIQSIYGIGATRAKKICEKLNFEPSRKTADLTDEEVKSLQDAINAYTHEGDLRREVATNIKRKKDIKCYSGLRHRMGLPVRGQRTKTNARTRKGRKGGKSGKK